MVRGLNPCGGKIFSLLYSLPHRPWEPLIFLYNEYRGFLPEIKRLGLGVDHPLRSSNEVKERVSLYLYSSAPAWLVAGDL